MALWDALAKVAGLPLARLLGGTIGPVRAYNSNGLGRHEVSSLAAEAEGLMEDGGFTALKMRLGNEHRDAPLPRTRRAGSLLVRGVDRIRQPRWLRPTRQQGSDAVAGGRKLLWCKGSLELPGIRWRALRDGQSHPDRRRHGLDAHRGGCGGRGNTDLQPSVPGVRGALVACHSDGPLARMGRLGPSHPYRPSTAGRGDGSGTRRAG